MKNISASDVKVFVDGVEVKGFSEMHIKRKLLPGMSVVVKDNSFNFKVTKEGLKAYGTPGNCLGVKSPKFIILATNLKLPVPDHPLFSGEDFIEKFGYNDTIILNPKTDEVYFTREKFLAFCGGE